MIPKKLSVFILAILSFFLLAATVFAVVDVSKVSEKEMTFLRMYFTDEELGIVSATRSLKSIDCVAENVEVVSKAEIEMMGAHTVGEVLGRINGVQVQPSGANTFSLSGIMIQGSFASRVTVMIDGVIVNDLAGNRPDLVAPMPVNFIERIEVIKGPASSAWGSALGGVINIITKAAGTSEKANGTLQASYGERETVDLGAELFGKKGGLGYYLSARGLETDGFNPENDRLNRNFFAKLSYGLFEDASIEGALMYNKNSGGVGLFTDWGVYDRDRMESLLSNLSLKSKIGAEMDMELSLKYAKGDWSYESYLAGTREPDPWFFPVETDNERYSASARLEWNPWRHSVVAGIDYEYGVVRSNSFDEDKLTLSKYAVFLNDTIIIGNLTVIPGLRLDDTDETDMFVSPSLGLVYELRPDTLLRLYVARGFNDPQIADLKGNSNWGEANPNLDPETVWSYQAGVETGILKHLWLKVSAFDHEIRDEIANVPSTTSPGKTTSVNIGKSRRRGLEAEMRTASFHNFVFSAAASIIRAKDLETDEEVKGVPTSTVDLVLSYDDESFRGSLNGHSVMWNEESYYEGRYNAMIFDLHLIKSIIRHGGVNVEVFATGHNIFNGAQYWTTPFINAGRWIEAGLRMKF